MTSPDPATTVLYVLTTLAQSCAALAAFVGAVGVFRIQMLREQRRAGEDAVRDLAVAASIIPAVGFSKPINDIVESVDARYHAELLDPNELTAKAFLAVGAWRAFIAPLRRARSALLVLEGWNLAVICAALVCFNHVPFLAVAPWFSSALVIVSVVTACIPLGCVWVWTQGVEK